MNAALEDILEVTLGYRSLGARGEAELPESVVGKAIESDVFQGWDVLVKRRSNVHGCAEWTGVGSGVFLLCG